MEKGSHKVELTTSYDDWLQIRECFVQSFRHYALYKYMEPDGKRRDEFLRRYFEANYEVTVGVGKAILLAIKAPELCKDEKSKKEMKSGDGELKIIGGVMFLLPAGDWGWQAKDQQPFDDAYNRNKLHEVSPQGLARLKRYENWENELLEKPVKKCGLPMWNAIFCAISPEYTNMGICSMLYERAITIMADYWLASSNFYPAVHRGLISYQARRKSFGNLNEKSLGERRLSETTLDRPAVLQQGGDEVVTTPLVLAVSHSDRSASFHKSNGFTPMQLIPFHDQVDDVTPFYVHILAHEPCNRAASSCNLPRFDASVREMIAAPTTTCLPQEEVVKAS